MAAEMTPGAAKLGRRTHDIRIGMSLYWVEMWPESRVDIDGRVDGHGWSALSGRVRGFTAGTRADALAEVREALLAREALHRVVVKQDEETVP